jgi:hypothetical protein
MSSVPALLAAESVDDTLLRFFACRARAVLEFVDERRGAECSPLSASVPSVAGRDTEDPSAFGSTLAEPHARLLCGFWFLNQ